ncbi:MAG: DUF4932 domain-containing protein [Planctomycetota bacterium]
MKSSISIRKRVCIIVAVPLTLSLWLSDGLAREVATGTTREANSASSELNTATVPIEVTVDPRVELISIIFRLAGNPEYNKGRLVSYNKDIERHFRAYASHPVVELASELRRTRGVSYDAPMSLAIHASDANSLNERVPFDGQPAGLDGRWRVDEVRDFLEKARQFAKETEEFFGARPGAGFRLVLGMANGPNNYGTRIELATGEEFYCILGVWKLGMFGFGDPQFDTSMIDTIVHEFCHSYVNPLVYAHSSELEKAGMQMFPKVQKKMRRMAYGNWQTMMHESVVRACVVRYLLATMGPDEARKQVKREINNGFVWMEELSELLGQYEGERDVYATFESFFPNVIKFFNSNAENKD